jgi:hypothetical protein
MTSCCHIKPRWGLTFPVMPTKLHAHISGPGLDPRVAGVPLTTKIARFRVDRQVIGEIRIEAQVWLESQQR